MHMWFVDLAFPQQVLPNGWCNSKGLDANREAVSHQLP
jgi:hypothetical protein